MSGTEKQFRTVAFGGFCKEDVLSYIASSARDHQERLDSLQSELERARQGRSDMERHAADCGKELAMLSAEKEQLVEENAKLRSMLADAEEAGKRLSEAESVITRQQQRLAQVEPDAEAYDRIRDQAASMELEAHRRAKAMELEAKEKAERTIRTMEQWIRKLQGEYDQLRTAMESAVTRTTGELDRARKSLMDLAVGFDRNDELFQQLLEDYRTPAPAPRTARPPRPLRLDEE